MSTENTNGIPQKYVDAAKYYCELRGLNPEELIGHAPPPDEHGVVLSIYLQSPRWMLVARELEEHDVRSRSLLHGTSYVFLPR